MSEQSKLMKNPLPSTVASVRSIAQWLVLAAVLFMSGPLARATVVYWDPLATHTGNSSTTTDGNGTWDSTATADKHWYVSGVGDTEWAAVSGDDVSIGSGGTTAYNVKGKTSLITVGNITFNSMGSGGLYTISGSVMNLTGGTITDNNTAAANLFYVSSLEVGTTSGSITFTKAGGGMLQMSSMSPILTGSASPSMEISAGGVQFAKLFPLSSTQTLKVDSGATNDLYTSTGGTIAGLTGAGLVMDSSTSTADTLTIGGSGGTYTGTFTGSALSLTLNGTGTEIINGAANTYGGATLIEGGGTLEFGSGATCANSPFTVANAAGNTLYILQPASTANAQWTCLGLTNQGAGAITIDYNNNTPSTTTAPIKTTNLATNTVGVTFTSANSTTITVKNVTMATANYPLITASSLTVTNGYQLGTLPTGISGYLAVSGNTLELVASSASCPTITFTPASGGTLTAGTAGTSYNNTSVSATDTGGTPSDTTITYSASGLPAGLSISGTAVASGTAATISGTPTQAGTFTVTVTATGNNSGGTCAISASYTLVIAPGALAKYGVTVGSSQTTYNQFPVTITAWDANSNTITTGAGSTATVTMSHNSGLPNLVFASSKVTLFNGTNTVVAVDDTAEGPGTITATDGSANSGTSGNVTVTAAASLIWDPSGTKTAGSDGAANWDVGSAEWANGSTDVNWANNDTASIGTSANNTKYTIKVSSAVTVGAITFNQENAGRYAVSGSAITLTGGLVTDNNFSPAPSGGFDKVGSATTINCGGMSFTKDGQGTFQLSTVTINSTNAVGMEVRNGTLESGVTTGNTLPAGILQVDYTSVATVPTFDLEGSSATVAGIQSANSGGGNTTAPNIASGATGSTLTINGSGNYTYNGTIEPGTASFLALTFSGTGTNTLGGTCTYTGATTVNSGKVLINGTSASAVSVASGANFGGTGTISANVTYAPGALATFTVTSSGGANTTPLTVSGGGVLAFSSGTATVVHLNLPSNLPGGTYTLATAGSAPTSSVNATPVIDSGSATGTTSLAIVGDNLVLTVTCNAVNSTAYTVTGGGSYCTGGSVDIGLSGSDSGVYYQLFNGAATVGSPVLGTGSAIDFGTAAYATGTYTVSNTPTGGYCISDMTGSV